MNRETPQEIIRCIAFLCGVIWVIAGFVKVMTTGDYNLIQTALLYLILLEVSGD